MKKRKGLIRGTSSAVLLSAAIHGGILLLATGFVVFTIIEKQEAKFVPQKIDRPKMKLKKLRVKIKEQAKPRKTTQRIASTRKSADLPDIQLPPMIGMGVGLEGTIDGFDMMADLASMTLMGAGKSVGNDLEGTFYDLSLDRSGHPNGMQAVMQGGMKYQALVKSFLANNWSPHIFDEYYRAPLKLYATQFMVPPTASIIGPAQFGIDPDDIRNGGALWLVHYKGKIAHPTGGTFRFRGASEDMAFVRLGGKLVWKSSYRGRFNPVDPENWKSSSDEDQKYGLGNMSARVGDWFTLEPSVPVEMELITGEDVGGWYCCMLLVEELGVEYPLNQDGGPILPMFKTVDTPEHIKDQIKYLSVKNDFSVEGGPVFSLY